MDLKPFTGTLDSEQQDQPLKPFDGDLDGQPAKESPGFVGAAVRGFKRSLPETKSLLAGAGAAVAGALGADGLRDKALDYYQKVQREEVDPLANDASFIGGIKGESSLGEWAGDTLGNFAGQAAQSLATAGAGAVVGSAVPGAGTAGGAVAGFVAKPLIKRALGSKVAEMVAERALTAGGRKMLGGAAIGAGLNTAVNVGQETGIAFTERAADAQAAGEDLQQADALRAIAAGVPAGLLDTAAEALVAGRFLKGASQSPKITRRLAAGATKGAVTEGATEGAQAVLERAGAAQELTGQEAYTDYVENVAAGMLGGGVAGGPAGIRRPLVVDQFTGQASEAPDPASGPLSRVVNEGAANGAVVTATPAAPMQPQNAGMFERIAAEQAAARQQRELAGEAPLGGADGEDLFASGTPRQDPGYAIPPRSDDAGPSLTLTDQARTAQPQVNPSTGEILVPAGEDGRAPRTSRWLDDAGVPRAPTDEELGAFMHETLDAMGSPPSVKRGEIFQAARAEDGALERDQLERVFKQVSMERKAAFEYPAESDQGTMSGGSGDAEFSGNSGVAQSLRAKVTGGVDTEGATSAEIGSLDTTAAQPLPNGVLGDTQALSNPASGEATVEQPLGLGEVPGQRSRGVVGSDRLQPTANDVTGDTELPRNGSNALAGRPQSFDALDVNEQRVVKSRVRSALEDRKILDSVVELHPVEVMNVLGREELSADLLSGNKAMLLDGLTTALDNPVSTPAVSRFIDRVTADHPGTLAPLGAEEIGLPSNSAGSSVKDGAAVGAVDGGHAINGARPPNASQAPSQPTRESVAPVIAAASEAATSPDNNLVTPTPAQVEAGNFRVGRLKINGLDISIEHPAGVKRKASHSKKLRHAYGYLRKTTGADGEKFDVFLGERADDTSLPVFVVDQKKADGSFDESKAMLGFKDEASARAAYLSNYPKGWEQSGYGGIKQMSHDEFKAWVRDPEATKKPAAAPAMTAPAESPAAAPSVKAEEKKEAQKPAANTEDAGEELWYNRRNRSGAGLRWADIEGLNATLKVKEAVKSKVWPRPDYEALVQDGMPAHVAHTIKQVYDGLATRPQTQIAPTDAQLQQYIETIGAIRDAAFEWAKKGDYPSDALMNAAFPIPEGAKSRFRDSEGRSRENNIRAMLIGANKAIRALSIDIRTHMATAIKATKTGWPLAQEPWRRYYTITEHSGRFRVSRAGRTIARDLGDRAAAEEVAKTDYEQRQKERTSKGKMADESISLQEAVRTGAARRAADEDVDSDRLQKTFGFRGVNFGNWMKGDAKGATRERQLHLNHTYDAFLDLAEILQIPAKALSLDGMLGIAFGAQGSGGAAAAHFVPGVNEINLTRKAGVGALAHEWAHALDHYFAVQGGDGFAKREEPFLTHIVDGGGKVESATLRPEIVEAFRKIVTAMTRRPMTEEERAVGAAAARSRNLSSLDGWIAYFRKNLEQTAKPAEKARALEEFEVLASRMRSGDLGEGYVAAPGSAGGFRPAVAAVRNLFKDATGRVPSPREMNSLSANAVHFAHVAQQRTDDRAHVPQTVASEYLTQARRLDGASTGQKKGYWTMRTELFARAFQSYVLDKLAQRAAQNDYLTRPQMSEEATKVAMEAGLVSGDRYPRGSERQAINDAFDALASEFKTKEEGGKVALFSRRGWAEDFPDAVLGYKQGFLATHPDYLAAKAGDDRAALRLARDVVTPEYVAALRKGLPKTGRTLVLPVRAIEAAGKNRIPAMAARVVADKLGLKVAEDVVQSKQVSRGGGSGMYRLANAPEFAGAVVRGANYLILDDTLTQGGTLAALKTYIEDNGGKVVLATALTGQLRSAKLAPSAQTLQQLRERFGSIESWWRDTFGYGFEGFTESEAKHLLDAKDRPTPQQVRDRVTAARVQDERGVGAADDRDGGDRPALSRAVSGTVPVVQASLAKESPEQLWRAADTYYRAKLQGRVLEGPDGNVKFSNSGRSKALSTGRRDALRMGVARKLADLVKVARIYDDNVASTDNDAEVFAYAAAPVEVDGKVYAVRLLYRKTPQMQERGFYTFEGYEIEDPGAMDRGRPDGLALRGSPGSEVSVADLVAAFNGTPGFSRALRAGGLDFDRALTLKRQLTSKWGENAPNVVLVRSAEELQQSAGLPRSVLQDPDFYRSEGVYMGRPTVWINTAAIRSEERFAQVLAHEALGHYGVERVVGRGEWRSIAKAIESHRANGSGAKDVREAIARVLDTQPDEVLSDRELFAKEVIAVMAENGSRNGLLQRFVAAVQRFLRRIMPGRSWSTSEIRDLLNQSDSLLHRGRTNAEAQATARAYAFSKRGEAPVFYSALGEAVAAGKGAPKKGDAAAWKGWLDGAQRRGEFKQAERDWLGVDAWLDAQGAVTRDQLAEFVRANQVQVQDVMLGGPGTQRMDLPDDWDVEDDGDGGFVVLDENGDERGFGATVEDAVANAQDGDERSDALAAGATKFGRYQLHGGENYREMLLTLPTIGKGSRGRQTRIEVARARMEELQAEWAHADDIGDTESADRLLAEARALSEEMGGATMGELEAQARGGVNAFHGGHFDRPNVLAHVRFNERTDVDGKKVLFLEEIQSDWHQKGRKNGYAKIDPAAPWEVFNTFTGTVVGRHANEQDARDDAENRGAQFDWEMGAPGAVPDAPFKGTDEWAMLAFKRMVRHAAENGFDRIAWTTGEQQAERYDLSKQVDAIGYRKTDAGYTIYTWPLNSTSRTEWQTIKAGVKPADLAEVVGKDVADKIMAGDGAVEGSRTVLRGNDLRVGGGGMRGFYDKILPTAVNKWAKKFGGKVGQAEINISSAQGGPLNRQLPANVHALDLTPAMREAALAGLPQFSRENAGAEIDADAAFVAGLSDKERASPAMAAFAQAMFADLGTDSPFFQHWFGDSKVVDAAGKPLKVYHGTNAEFQAFDPARLGKSTNHMTAALGTFFDARKSKAEHYARIASNDVPAEQQVYEVYLAVQNPYRMSKDEFMSIDSIDKARETRARLQREGHDGIQLYDIGQWIAFRPEQIKRTDNRGTFTPSEPRMLFSRAPGDTIDAVETAVREINGEVEGGSAVLDRVKKWLKASTPPQLKNRLRGYWLATLTTRHLTELGSDYFPTMGIYSDYLAEMGADRNTLAQEAETVAEGTRKWAGKHMKEAAELFDLMHKATIMGVDPAEAYQPLQFTMSGGKHEVNAKNVKEAIKVLREVMRGRSGDDKRGMIEEAQGLRAMLKAEPKRRANYPDLVARWNQLSPEAQAHYRTMRDLYAKRHDQTEAALIQRINDLKMEGGEKRKQVLVNVIRQQFEQQRLQGVYFPLQRFGKYFVAAELGDSSTFMMFETQPDLEKAVVGLRKRGFKITAQGLKGAGKAKDAPSGTFVAEVLEHLQKSGVAESTRDEIYQMYLHALPELSMRKHKIHRKAVPGWDPDALRAFSFNMHHGAHQLARLRYAHKLSDMIEVLQAQQDARRKEEGGDTAQIVAGDAILGELRHRHEWISNPQDSKITNLISSFGFTYFLGLTPAAALVNLTQVPMLAFPHLASRFGAGKAMNQLLVAMKSSARTLGHAQRTLTDPEDLRAHQALQAAGALDKTQVHNLAGIAEGGLSGHNPKWAKAMEIVGKPFHVAEVVNREATGLAAFRLARADGMSFDAAVKFAADAIHETMFDYTNANRARFMQSGPAKVLLMFRQYSLNMTWLLGRMVWQATKGADPEVKRIARRNLTGVLGMSALFSGALGLPLASVTMGVLNAIAASAGDDDEPWEAEVEFRAFLADLLGPTAASIVLDGPVNKITGADVASRVSMSQLWVRDADRELDGRGAYYNLLEQAAGPMGGVLKNALVGKQLIDDGHVMRGVETMLPKAIKDMVKSARYATQGVNNLRGDPMVADVSLRQALLQAGGFTPAEVSERYDQNSALKNYEQHVMQRRERLVNAFAMAVRIDDAEARAEALEAIRGFNRKWPEIAITPGTIRKSLAARERYSRQAENGIIINRKIAGRLRDAVGAE